MARTKDFKEEEVLEKAVCLFWHKGYNGTSMQELVDHLGISRSSLYDTYADKHTLYIKALEHYQNTSGSKMCEIISESVSAREAIRQLLEMVTGDLLNDEQQKGCFMVNAEVEISAHDEEVRQIVRRNEEGLENAFYKAIKKGQESGEITTKQDARALARFIFNNVKGIQVSAKSVKDPAFFEDIIRITMSVLG